MAKVNGGVDAIAQNMGNTVAAFTGTASASSSTTLTGSGFTGSAYVGMYVVADGVYGYITANTTTVLTVERWVNPLTPGGSAGTTPGTTAKFVIMPGITAAGFMALTANSSATVATDTTLSGEITTASGGLIRKICSFAHTAATSTYTEAVTFTANGSDSLPVTVAKAGMFNTLTGATGIMVWETLLSATATFAASGDAATITQTVTIS
jgi:hypothetical protein